MSATHFISEESYVVVLPRRIGCIYDLPRVLSSAHGPAGKLQPVLLVGPSQRHDFDLAALADHYVVFVTEEAAPCTFL